MIRVVIEVIPHGVVGEQRTIAVGRIENTLDCENRPSHGNYNVEFSTDFGPLKGRVENFNRNTGPIKLVIESLESLLK